MLPEFPRYIPIKSAIFNNSCFPVMAVVRWVLWSDVDGFQRSVLLTDHANSIDLRYYTKLNGTCRTVQAWHECSGSRGSGSTNIIRLSVKYSRLHNVEIPVELTSSRRDISLTRGGSVVTKWLRIVYFNYSPGNFNGIVLAHRKEHKMQDVSHFINICPTISTWVLTCMIFFIDFDGGFQMIKRKVFVILPSFGDSMWIPVDTQRNYNVIVMSKRRSDVLLA